MSEHPVFIPHGDGERLAAVISLPEGEPRGLVLLLTGGSAARSHRYGVWTRVAADLAGRGIASVRFDYLGTGDSTGALRQWQMKEAPVDQAASVARFGMRVAGVRRVGIVGNCIGARVALGLAAQMPEVEATLCIRAPVLQPSGTSKLIERAGRSGIGAKLRSNPLIRTYLVKPLSGRKRRSGTAVRGPIGRILSRGRLLFLYGEEDYTFNEQVRAELAAIVARLPQEQRRRYELRVLPERGLKGFDSLEVQDVVIATVVGWFDTVFNGDASAVTRPGRAAAS